MRRRLFLEADGTSQWIELEQDSQSVERTCYRAFHPVPIKYKAVRINLGPMHTVIYVEQHSGIDPLDIILKGIFK